MPARPGLKTGKQTRKRKPCSRHRNKGSKCSGGKEMLFKIKEVATTEDQKDVHEGRIADHGRHEESFLHLELHA